jgi:hypothetical protein
MHASFLHASGACRGEESGGEVPQDGRRSAYDGKFSMLNVSGEKKTAEAVARHLAIPCRRGVLYFRVLAHPFHPSSAETAIF